MERRLHLPSLVLSGVTDKDLLVQYNTVTALSSLAMELSEEPESVLSLSEGQSFDGVSELIDRVFFVPYIGCYYPIRSLFHSVRQFQCFFPFQGSISCFPDRVAILAFLWKSTPNSASVAETITAHLLAYFVRVSVRTIH